MIDQLEKEIHEGMLDLYQHQSMSRERESIVYFYFAGIHNENIILKEEIERQKEIIRQLDIKNLELTTTLKEVRECINHYAIENEDYSKIYNDEEKELLSILRGEDNENTRL